MTSPRDKLPELPENEGLPTYDADQMRTYALTALAQRDAEVERLRRVLEEISDPRRLPSHGDPANLRAHALYALINVTDAALTNPQEKTG